MKIMLDKHIPSVIYWYYQTFKEAVMHPMQRLAKREVERSLRVIKIDMVALPDEIILEIQKHLDAIQKVLDRD